MKAYVEPHLREYSGKKMPFYLRRSFYVHLALFSLTLIGGKVISIQQERLREKNMELVQASVRVDMVAMPKYTLNELKNISSGVEEAKKEEPAPVQEVKKEEPEPVKEEAKESEKTKSTDEPSFEEASKKKQADFLSKLKQIGSKKIKSEGNVKAEKGLYGDKASALKALVLSGNKLSKGVAIYGDGNAAEMTAFQAYAARLPDVVRPRWRLPDFLLNKKLRCVVRVWVSSNGEISRVEVAKSSGDNEYDQRALEAVRSTQSFPRPSSDIVKRAENGNIYLGFPL